MTIKEIAKLAGVSVSTVSKIMNGKDESISAETRAHVLRIAKEYHYKPYASVLTANTAKTLSIGVLFRDTTTLSLAVNGILSVAGKEGYSVLFRESALSAEQELKNLSALIRAKVDGIIWEPVSSTSLDYAEQLSRAGIPFLTINNHADPAALNIDFCRMGYLATEALIQNSHSEIACSLTGGAHTDAFFEGYRQCLFAHQIAFDDALVFRDEEVPLSKLSNHLFSGIVVSHYAAALSLYKSMETLHYAVPYDLSIISLKEDTYVHADYPPISTLTIPHAAFGAYAAEQLLHLIEKKDAVPAPAFDFAPDSLLSIDIPYNARLKKIISIGSINIDNYMNFEKLPHPGKTVSTALSVVHPGGKCINQAIGAAKLGHSTFAIGRVGDDADADFLYSYIKNYSVDTYGIKRTKNSKTGQAYIFVQDDGNSMISIMSGANNAVSPQDIRDNERLFANAGYCLLQTEIPMESIIEAGRIAKKHGLTTVLKPSACTEVPPALLKHVDIIVPNLDELNEICPGPQTLSEKAGQLLSHGIQTVIVTLGADGCYLRTRTESLTLPAADFVSVDSSGAGDAFICALVSYLLYGYDLIRATRIATYAAGFSTTRQGTTPALIDRDTLEAYIRRKEPELLAL